MTLQIDRSGRIVLPKPVRDRLGIQSGAELEMEEAPDGVFLKVRQAGPAILKKDGLPVYVGDIPDGFDIRRAIAADRDERAVSILGM